MGQVCFLENHLIVKDHPTVKESQRGLKEDGMNGTQEGSRGTKKIQKSSRGYMETQKRRRVLKDPPSVEEDAKNFRDSQSRAAQLEADSHALRERIMGHCENHIAPDFGMGDEQPRRRDEYSSSLADPEITTNPSSVHYRSEWRGQSA